MSYRHLVVVEPFDGYARGDIIKDPIKVADIRLERAAYVVERQPGADEEDDAPEPSIHSGPDPTTAEERTAAVIEDVQDPPRKR